MLKVLAIAGALLAGTFLRAEPVCVDGVCYPSEEAAREAGVILPVGAGQHDASPSPAIHTETAADADGRRLAMGYMSSAELIAFLRNEQPTASLEDHALWLIILLVLLGGLAANLTPCVLPLVPINLILIGKGWRRGAAYAAGITTAYGVLGLAAALGGLAFGTLQSSPWFNGGVAVVFTILALAMLDLFHLKGLSGLKGLFKGLGRSGSSGARGSSSSSGTAGPKGLMGFDGLKAYMLGLGAATLAGACVEPILIATLLLTAKWFAVGRVWAVVLPFVLGAGMGLPYPFAAAGLSVLPKPGAWMVWVKRVFALVFFIMAGWYGWQVAQTLTPPTSSKPLTPLTSLTSAKPVFIKIGAPWCRNCAAMARTTFKDPAVVHELSAYEVREIEIESFADLARYPELAGLDIKGLPAYVVVEKRENR